MKLGNLYRAVMADIRQWLISVEMVKIHTAHSCMTELDNCAKNIWRFIQGDHCIGRDLNLSPSQHSTSSHYLADNTRRL